MNVFDHVFTYGGVAAMKVAPPSHKKTPEPIQELSIFHHNRTTNETFDEIIKCLKDMPDESYEYSRLGIQFALQHILDEIHDLKNSFGSRVIFQNNHEVFVSLFENMVEYFEDMKKQKKKNFNKKMVQAEIEAITSFSEGILFLKKSAEKEKALVPLIEKYETYQKELFTKLDENQKALKILQPKYTPVTVEAIFEAAQKELEHSMKFRYNELLVDTIDRLIMRMGERNQYWYAIQDDKKWKKLYEDERQALSTHDLTKCRELLPVIFEQYQNLHHFSFTNMIKVLALCSNYYGDRLSVRNEHQPKDEFEHKSKQEYLDLEVQEENKSRLHKLSHKEAQKPEVTHENLAFASKILGASLTLTTLLDDVCGFVNQDNCIYLEKYNEEFDVVRKKDADVAIIFYKDHNRLYGCLIDVVDLNNNKIKNYDDVVKDSKGSSFIGMSQFLREIKEPFLQEYFFGKQSTSLNLIDRRS